MDDSILVSIKKLLGIDSSYTVYDTDIIIFINSAFSFLNQLGIGPEEGFSIKNESSTWSEYLESEERLEFVKEYVYLKVKLLFDPPQSSSVLDAYNNLIKELEWRMNVMQEFIESEDSNAN